MKKRVLIMLVVTSYAFACDAQLKYRKTEAFMKRVKYSSELGIKDYDLAYVDKLPGGAYRQQDMVSMTHGCRLAISMMNDSNYVKKLIVDGSNIINTTKGAITIDFNSITGYWTIDFIEHTYVVGDDTRHVRFLNAKDYHEKNADEKIVNK